MEVSVTISPSKEESAVDHPPRDGEEEKEKEDDGSDDNDENENVSSSEHRSTEEEMELTETLETKDSNDSMTANSLSDTAPSLGESTSKDCDEKQHEIDITFSTTVKTFVFSPNWSKTFESPVGSQGFSPSQTGSNHGLGLQLALERNISTALFLGNISTFLSNMANVYEQLGINLVKISYTVSPQPLSFKTSIDDDFRSLHEAILSLGSGFQNSAECYRKSIVASLQKILTAIGNERDRAVRRYRETRQASVEARKAALTNYSKSTNAVKAAETEIRAWLLNLQQKQNEIVEGTTENGETIEILETDLPWEKSLKLIGRKQNDNKSTSRLIQKLKVVQSYEKKYIISVENENKWVELSQENEGFALEKSQKAEEDKMNFFVSVILAKVFPEDENEGNVSAIRPSFKISDEGKPSGIEKKGIELLSTLNLFKSQSTPYEEGMGVMDAETLGLPEDLGIQRDKIKSCFSARADRIKVTEIVLKLFEEITNVTAKFSFRMRSQITNQRRKDAFDDPTSGSFSSSQAGSLWRKTLRIFEDEAKLVSEIAFKIAILENWFSRSRKNLEYEIDLDDNNWKQVCDAARMEMRLESRYKQTKQQMEKARQRASSKEVGLSLSRLGSTDYSDDNPQSQSRRIDSPGSVSSLAPSTPNKVGRAFLKGGEAMKKFIRMTENDQKEGKDQLALEEAMAGKKRAVLAYATYTKELIDKIESEDESGWAEMKGIIDKSVNSMKASNKARSTVFGNRLSQELQNSYQSMVANTEEWSENVRQKILKSKQLSSSTTDAISEYTLTMKPIKSGNVKQLLGMTANDITIPKLDVETEAAKEESDEEVIDSRKITPSDRPEKPSQKTRIEERQKPKASSDTLTPSSLEKENQTVSGVVDRPEIKAFIKQFWSNKPKDQKIPDVLEIHICAYRPKERVAILAINSYGRLYTTSDAIYFLGGDKHFTLRWGTITSIEKEKGFMGSNNDTDLVVSYRSKKKILSFLLTRLKDRDKVVTHLQRLKAESDVSELSEVPECNSTTVVQSPVVPPDSTLKGMDVVLCKTIKNVSVKSLFENAWADRSERESFYGSWLNDEECFDITMEEWKIAKFKNEWCNEEYDQYRFVTFKFNRTTHLYLGPPVAFVKQRHFVRVEGNDRCVLAISAEFEGIPYADTFAVEMRWVATRKGANDVQVEVGLFVNFMKKTMLKSQIKAGTIEETKSVHLRLFGAVKKVCKSLHGGQSGDEVDEEEVEDESIEISNVEPGLLAKLGSFASSLDVSTIATSVGVVSLLFFGKCFAYTLLGSSSHSDTHRLENRIQELQDEVRALHKSIDLVTRLLREMKSEYNESN